RTLFCRLGDHAPWEWLRQHDVDVGTLRAWGSVLTAAFDLAVRSGANPIIFAGADLAFSGGQPYARGTTNEEDWAREVAWGTTLAEVWSGIVNSWAPLEAPGIDGTAVPTAAHLQAFRDWIVERSLTLTDRRIINASGRGILHGGA